MEQFIAGLFCIALGWIITGGIVLCNADITFANAGLWTWLPAIIGTVLGLLIWTGGDFDFDINPFD